MTFCFVRIMGVVLTVGLVTSACSNREPLSGTLDQDSSAGHVEEPAELVVEGSSGSEESSEEREEGEEEKIVEAAGVVSEELLNASAEGLTGDELLEYMAKRYKAFWTLYDSARTAPSSDPLGDYPVLAQLAAGEQLENSKEAIIHLREQGQAMREPDTSAIGSSVTDDEHRVRVEVIDKAMVEISACMVNDDVLYDTATGEIIQHEVLTVESKGHMVRTDGKWKLIRSQATDITDGVGGCWEDLDSFPL